MVPSIWTCGWLSVLFYLPRPIPHTSFNLGLFIVSQVFPDWLKEFFICRLQPDTRTEKETQALGQLEESEESFCGMRTAKE